MAQSLVDYDVLAADVLDDLEALRQAAQSHQCAVDEQMSVGQLQLQLFEKVVEHQLMEPTFILQHPVEVSPVSETLLDPFYSQLHELHYDPSSAQNFYSIPQTLS